MRIDIDSLSLSDLYDLNKRVVDRIKTLRSIEDQKLANDLSVGDIVSFINKLGHKEQGVVTKVNKKTAKVKTQSVTWTISLSLLTKEMSIEQIKQLKKEINQ